MDDQQRTWTSEEALGNLESLVRLDWDRGKLPEGAKELLQTYEAAIPELAAEIQSLRGKLKEAQKEQKREESGEDSSEDESSDSTDAYEDLAAFARRLGLEQR